MRPANPMLLRVDARAPQTSVLREVVRVLKAGGLAVLPTETVYGVAADPAVAGAEDRIYAAKARDRGKPIPLLAASLEDVERAGGRLGPWARRLAYKYWPGPLTQVLECGGRTEGFRVPRPSRRAGRPQGGGRRPARDQCQRERAAGGARCRGGAPGPRFIRRRGA